MGPGSIHDGDNYDTAGQYNDERISAGYECMTDPTITRHGGAKAAATFKYSFVELRSTIIGEKSYPNVGTF